ncbi:hypothetical protein FNF27_03238 [Cafeteria roenbergensis]|uniref:AB hydrolase-1 domain-containing protein n=1 Tax=Cafeteria roenbergensis TaxID=33653 RepID=A0A5A8EH36_CAFRO|nr:hypothetical protein FNF27_03238 [Cafeteria roenbergensis]|mmetsp:Transcript_22118/g.84130  ORF Transcript_22118/g.84130 Transcript_22118/m.84130 type:complete len:393 (+) Transcript_22118:112-1290(+)
MAAAAGRSSAWETTWGPPTHSCLPARPAPAFVSRRTAGGHEHRIAYFLYEPSADVPRKRPVVCGHGLTRNSFDFHWLATRLAELGHPVACYDAPGRAASEPLADASEYTYAEYGPSVKAVAAALGWTSCHWVGTSMGGILGMLVAADPPKAAPSGSAEDLPPSSGSGHGSLAPGASPGASSASAAPSIGALVLVDIGPEVPQPALRRIVEYVGAPLKGGELGGIEGAESYVSETFPGMLPVPTELRRRQCAAFLTRPVAGTASEAVPSKSPFAATPADVDDAAPRCPAYDARMRQALPAPDAVQAMAMWPLWAALRCRSLTVLRGAESAVFPAACAARMVAEPPEGVATRRVDLVTLEGVGHAPTLWSPEQADTVVTAITEAESAWPAGGAE